MLGFYENFPANIHKTSTFTTAISNKKLQQTLALILSETNNKTYNLDDVADPSVPNCTVIFEFGIAEADTFNYLDDEEVDKIIKIVEKKPLQVMDFYCAIRYYKMEKEKKTPLKFDYYMIRFVFNKNLVETRIFHERGLRYVTPEDVTNFIINKINEKFSKRVLKLA